MNQNSYIRSRKKVIDNSIQHLEQMQDDRILEEGEWSDLVSFKKELFDMLQTNHIKWAQRSKDKWIKEGDANTKYFHMCVSARRKKNLIPRLLIDGIETTDQEEISNHILDFYKDLFGKGGKLWGEINPNCWTEMKRLIQKIMLI